MSEFAPTSVPSEEKRVQDPELAAAEAYASKPSHDLAAEMRGRNEGLDPNEREAIENRKAAALIDGFGNSQENAAQESFQNPEANVEIPALNADIIKKQKQMAHAAVREAFRHAA